MPRSWSILDTSAIERELGRLLDDQGLADDLQGRGLERAAAFSLGPPPPKKTAELTSLRTRHAVGS